MLKVLALLLALLDSASAQVPMTGAGLATTVASVSLSCSYAPVTTATQNVAYTGATPSASGGTPGYTYSETGSLPPGFSLNTGTGVISGTDTGTGTYPGIQLIVTDSASNTANCGSSFTITVSTAACSEYTTFIARTSGTSSTEQGAYQAMICGMVTDGTWSLLDTLYIFATNTQTTALLNLVSTSYTGATNGTVSFAPDQGYTGDGSTFYIDTGWQTATGPNFTQNSASYGVYVLTSDTTFAITYMMGQDQDYYDILFQNKPSVVALISDFSSTDLAYVQTNIQGSYLVSRTGSATTALYKNGSSVATGTGTSHALFAADVFLFAANGQSGGLFPDQIAAAFTGAGLNSTQAAAVQSRINGYMTALGINVY